MSMAHCSVTLFPHYKGSTFFYFHKILQIDLEKVRRWNASIKLLEFPLLKKIVIHDTLLKECRFYFYTELLSNMN